MTLQDQYTMKTAWLFLIGLTLHLPVFFLLGHLNQHSPAFTALFCAGVLGAPLLAYKLKATRFLPSIIAFASLSFSGFLIHLGNGMIEFHFHIFIMIAALAMFASASPILVAVATIAIHHIAFFFILPKSVFNYEASFLIVLLHATFVLIEAVPVLYITNRFKYYMTLQTESIEELEPISARNKQLVTTMETRSENLLSVSTQSEASITSSNQDVASLLQQVSRNKVEAQEAQNTTENCNHLVAQSVQDINLLQNSISDISQSSDKIRAIIDIIDDIAFQTNMLALNAAIEAARAGEHGRGFGVVAEAVRALAQRCSSSARDIAEIISDNVHKIDQSNELAERNKVNLESIATTVHQIVSFNTEIAMSSSSQHDSLLNIQARFVELNALFHQINTSASELNERSKELAEDMQQLELIVQKNYENTSAQKGETTLPDTVPENLKAA